MNKKKLLIIIIAVVLTLSSFIVFLCLDNKGDNESDGELSNTTSDISWFKTVSLSELESLAEKTDKKIEYNAQDVYVMDLPFGEKTSTYNYRIDSNETIVGLNIGTILVDSTAKGEEFIMDDVSAQELSDSVNILLGWISDTLNVTIANNFYVFSDNGDMLAVDEISSYQEIIDGTAYLELRILDVDGSVWILYVEKMHGYNVIYCTFEHCMADSDEAKIPCNVSIE